MTKTETVTIGGEQYDPVTGLRMSQLVSAPVQQAHRVNTTATATALHATLQRSTTLQRKFTKKPEHKHPLIHKHTPISHTAVHQAHPIAHPQVRRFAPHTVATTSATTPRKVMDFGPVTHPHVAKAHALSAAKAAQAQPPLTRTLPSAREINHEAVKTAVSNTTKKAPLKDRLLPRQRIVTVLSAVVALMLLGGYLTYLNMPALSVRVAAAQAGIDASYPSYHPDGYALNGPVTYTNGKVSMNFKANGGGQAFALSESKSGWDSDAVLDNYVSPRAGSDYIPYSERGLTIYTYGNNAAWVNGGILYTVEGDAPLSSQQIRQIATSLL